MEKRKSACFARNNGFAAAMLSRAMEQERVAG
jgi:hypothetical protein